MYQTPRPTPPPSPPPSSTSPPEILNPNAEPFRPVTTKILPVAQSACPPDMQLIPLDFHPPALFPVMVQYYYQPYVPVLVPCYPNIEHYDNTYVQPPYVDYMYNSSENEFMENEDAGKLGFSGERINFKGRKKYVAPRHRQRENVLSNIEARSSCWTELEAAIQGKTTMMMKNIPYEFERANLLQLLNQHCRRENIAAESRSDECRSEYDFVYLSMEFAQGVHGNLGYGFINFTTPEAALRFFRAFCRYGWEDSDGKRRLYRVTAATIQGKDALRNHFENKKFPCKLDYLPVILSPPCDGFVETKLIPIGKRVGVNQNRVERKIEMLRIK